MGHKPSRPHLSSSKATAWALLALFLPLGAWLVVESRRPGRPPTAGLLELLRTNPAFDLAMLDFSLTAGWAVLVLGDRAGWRGWRFWTALPVFCVVPTLGIILYLLLQPRGERGRD